jgi:hypothetical protein
LKWLRNKRIAISFCAFFAVARAFAQAPAEAAPAAATPPAAAPAPVVEAAPSAPVTNSEAGTSTGRVIPAPMTQAPAIPEQNLKGVDTTNRRELSDDEINQQFFKKPGNEEVSELYMPIYYERMQRALGRIPSRVTSKVGVITNIEVDGIAMMAVLEVLVVESWTSKFEKLKADCEAAKTDEKKVKSLLGAVRGLYRQRRESRFRRARSRHPRACGAGASYAAHIFTDESQ